MCAPMLSAGIGLIGSVIQGVGAASALDAQARQQEAQAEITRRDYEAQAQIHERQANLERIKGSYEGRIMEERGRALIGKQIAAFGSSGVALSGSIAEVIFQTGESLGLDVAAARFGASIAIENEGILADVNRQHGETAKEFGMAAAADTRGAIPFAFAAPLIGGAGTFLNTAFG